jgi:hypothetical protein
MTITILLLVLAAVLALVGIAGSVLPILPGAALILAGVTLAAWAEDFQFVDAGTLVGVGVLAALTYLVDFVASAFGAKRYGASRRAVIFAIVGGVAGLFVGLIGVLLGPLVGAVVGELSARKGLLDASRAGIGTAIGMALGAAVKLALAFTMVGLFLLDRFLWGAT